MTVYRNGSMALTELNHPASRRHSGQSFSYAVRPQGDGLLLVDPELRPRVQCRHLLGDWGSPFAMTAELSASIAKEI